MQFRHQNSTRVRTISWIRMRCSEFTAERRPVSKLRGCTVCPSKRFFAGLLRKPPPCGLILVLRRYEDLCKAPQCHNIMEPSAVNIGMLSATVSNSPHCERLDPKAELSKIPLLPSTRWLARSKQSGFGMPTYEHPIQSAQTSYTECPNTLFSLLERTVLQPAASKTQRP